MHMLILHSKCSINVPISCVQPGTCRNIWNVPNLLSVGKWWVHSTRAYNVLKMFSLVSRPPRPQCKKRIHSSTYRSLDLGHRMVKSRPHHADQLTGNVDRLRRSTLIVPAVPLLRAAFHLRRIVGRQRQALEATAGGNGTSKYEIIKR